ncbi:plasmid mobilization protein [Streptomyces sp. CA-294286]|uniref:plasmid mobilization protein n=1 Tax=Streptomyces sp. CA-294286 TaxID=3240070 RepID=UPI003D93B0FC
MHAPHHELPTAQPEVTADLAPGGASWRFGHSPLGGASEPGSAPGAAEPGPRQGARTGKPVAEGGHQQGKPAGRPRIRDRQQRPAVSVRLNPDERRTAQAGADATGLSLAGFLAQSALAAARDLDRTQAAIATEHDTLSALFAVGRLLGNATNNLNQVAKALNSGADRPPHIDRVLNEVQHAVQDVRRVTARLTNPQDGQAA